MSRMKHPMSFLYGFFHEIVKKMLDTQMSGIKDPMSLLYGCFHEIVKKSSIPKCQELSIRYHFLCFFHFKKARYPNVTNEASAQTKSKRTVLKHSSDAGSGSDRNVTLTLQI